MFGLGTTEIIVILLIVLIIFGGSRLPQLGKGLGEAMKNFRDAFKDGSNSEAKSSMDRSKQEDARRSASEAEMQRGRDNSSDGQRSDPNKRS